jgi:hypothetical protein
MEWISGGTERQTIQPAHSTFQSPVGLWLCEQPAAAPSWSRRGSHQAPAATRKTRCENAALCRAERLRSFYLIFLHDRP